MSSLEHFKLYLTSRKNYRGWFRIQQFGISSPLDIYQPFNLMFRPSYVITISAAMLHVLPCSVVA